MVSLLALTALFVAGPIIEVPGDLQDSFQQLKAAESQKDAALVKKRAVETIQLARQLESSPAPESELERDSWTKVVAHARDIQVYSEYALYSTAIQSQSAVAVDLFATLEQQSPKSRYLNDAYGRYMLALNQSGAASTIPAMAERAIKNFPDNEDLLLYLADTAMTRKQTDRALGYAERLIKAISSHPKPENLSAAEWERKKSMTLGHGRWIAGVMHGDKTQYYESDRDLRVALPLIKGNDTMMSSALFYLGVANYHLGATTRNKAQVLEAVKFSEQAAAMKGPLAHQAWRNAVAMKAEADKIR
jgi:tetratricopeptide (TPR) repeat protein